ncbi:hypothetical protein D3C72_423410 [compost metagenome]
MGALLNDPDSNTEFTKAHNYISDFRAIVQALGGRYEAELVDLAIKEYESALFALAMGNYRGAFSGLRLAFEMNLAAIYFSAHEIDYRLWLVKAKDINWAVLVSSDNGVFSAAFANAFRSELNDERLHYQNLALTVYRECSEYVHGNAHTHGILPAGVEYSKEVVSAWCEKASTIQLIIIFAFALRYIQQLGRPALNQVESVMLENLGHLAPVQLVYQVAA